MYAVLIVIYVYSKISVVGNLKQEEPIIARKHKVGPHTRMMKKYKIMVWP